MTDLEFYERRYKLQNIHTLINEAITQLAEFGSEYDESSSLLVDAARPIAYKLADMNKGEE